MRQVAKAASGVGAIAGTTGLVLAATAGTAGATLYSDDVTFSDCTITSSVDVDHANDQFTFLGSISCDSEHDLLTINCSPHHKHTLYWDLHNPNTQGLASDAKSVSTSPSGIQNGTDGDRYKIWCGYNIDGNTGSVYSGDFNL